MGDQDGGAGRVEGCEDVEGFEFGDEVVDGFVEGEFARFDELERAD